MQRALLSHHSQHTVLVVDDDARLLGVLEDLLSRDGFEVVTAANGDRACEMLASIVPCMVLADVMMPGPLPLVVRRDS